MDHYNKGDGIKDPWLDEDMQPLALTETEIEDIVEFMAALTSSQYQQQGVKELERQRAISRTNRPQRDTATSLRLGVRQTDPRKRSGRVIVQESLPTLGRWTVVPDHISADG
jgi:cytochrome c peroxidase